MMQEIIISEIQFVPVKPQNGLVGFASFVLDEKYYVGSVAVYTRLNGIGYRLVYPTKKVGEKNVGVFYPINASAGKGIEEAVAEKVKGLFDGTLEENHV